MANGWNQKSITTQWSIAIVGFLVVTVALLIPVLNQPQVTRSNAMYQAGDGGHRVVPTSTPRCSTNDGSYNPVGCYCQKATPSVGYKKGILCKTGLTCIGGYSTNHVYSGRCTPVR